MKPMIELKQVSKSFKKTKALDNVSLSIGLGTIVGLMGPNGSGKSSLLRTIIGLYLPDKGSSVVLGADSGKMPSEIMGRIGYVHQEGELFSWMSVRQCIQYCKSYYSNWNDALEEQFIHRFRIDLKAKIANLTPGARQKVSILLAIGYEPELLLLDEPASALDPIQRANFLNLLLELIQQPHRTILISSHILSDVEKIIDHVIFMNQGSILEDLPFHELQEKFLKVKVSSSKLNPSELFADREGVVSSAGEGHQCELIIRQSKKKTIESILAQNQCHTTASKLSLEEIYRVIYSSQKANLL